MNERWAIRTFFWFQDDIEGALSVDREVLEQTLRAMATDEGAELVIYLAERVTSDGYVEDGPPTFFIGAYDGQYIVSYWKDAGTKYTLIGDLIAQGEVDLPIGGQGGMWPRKHIVGVEQAVAAALEYYGTGTIDSASGKWEISAW